MPYYIVDRRIVDLTDGYAVAGAAIYTTRDKQDAIDTRAIRAASGDSDAQYVIHFIADATEARVWRERERDRMRTGEYIGLPFATPSAHYAHYAIDHVGKIAYTPDDTHGHEDRQLVTTTGRYLDQFCNYFSDSEKQNAIASIKELSTPLRFAVTPDEIGRVYCADRSPGSCMGAGHRWTWQNAPVRAYGDSDLQVAYLGTLHPTDHTHDRISSRAVVWPEAKAYVRIYGDEYLMARKLKDAGYSEGDFEGARIRVIMDRGRLVGPYIDSDACYANKGSKWLTLTTDSTADYELRDTSGYACSNERCSNCGEQGSCNDDGYCRSCADAQWTCDHCDDTSYDTDYQHSHDYGTLCQSCHDDHNHTCTLCDTDHNEYDLSDRARRAHADWDYCPDCIGHAVTCDHCGNLTDDRQVKRHGHLARVCGTCRVELSQGQTRSRRQYVRARYTTRDRYIAARYTYVISRVARPKPIGVLRFTCDSAPIATGEFYSLFEQVQR